MCLSALQHLWDGGGGEADVYKGQVGEEEVHGDVEVGVWADGQDDEQVSKYSDQVHGEEKPKYDGLPFCFLWESQKVKFWNLCPVLWLHVMNVAIGKKKK